MIENFIEFKLIRESIDSRNNRHFFFYGPSMVNEFLMFVSSPNRCTQFTVLFHDLSDYIVSHRRRIQILNNLIRVRIEEEDQYCKMRTLLLILIDSDHVGNE